MNDSILIWETPLTNTAYFLIAPFGLSDTTPPYKHPDLGFMNAYVDDVHRSFERDDLVYMLFKPKNYLTFNKFTQLLTEKDYLLDDYDYEGGHVVVVLIFPKEFQKDYKLVLEGKYSKTSRKYQDLFPRTLKLSEPIRMNQAEFDAYQAENHTTWPPGSEPKTSSDRHGNVTYTISELPTNYYQVFEKQEGVLKKQIEDRIGINLREMFGDDFELWREWDSSRECLDIARILAEGK